MFLDQNARRHGSLGVVVEHWDRPLHDDRSAIQLLGDEVHSGTGNLHAMLQRLSLSIQSWERRKE